MPAKPPPLRERDFLHQVVSLATLLGWQVYHTYDSRRSAFGYPDLTLCRPPRLVYAELKTGKRQPTPAQKKWLELLTDCPVEVYEWWPTDADWEEIKRVLDR